MGERSFNKYFVIVMAMMRIGRRIYKEYRVATMPNSPGGEKITVEEGFEIGLAIQEELNLATPDLEWVIMAAPKEW